jgi:hypothetical protein
VLFSYGPAEQWMGTESLRPECRDDNPILLRQAGIYDVFALTRERK